MLEIGALTPRLTSARSSGPTQRIRVGVKARQENRKIGGGEGMGEEILGQGPNHRLEVKFPAVLSTEARQRPRPPYLGEVMTSQPGPQQEGVERSFPHAPASRDGDGSPQPGSQPQPKPTSLPPARPPAHPPVSTGQPLVPA